MSNDLIRILALGDVVGQAGRDELIRQCSRIKAHYCADLLIVNGENAAGGAGINPKIAQELRAAGVDVITLGDHTWERKEINSFLESKPEWCIRPANYPIPQAGPSAPGLGVTRVKTKTGVEVGVFNLLGRVFIQGALDCPFQKADQILSNELQGCKIIVLDMHAEATSEKYAMGHYLDGKVSFVFGTHTHVQTADQQILPNRTAFISDLGMCGPKDSVIGVDPEMAIRRFLTGRPFSFDVGKGAVMLSGALCVVDVQSGRAKTIERVQWLDRAIT